MKIPGVVTVALLCVGVRAFTPFWRIKPAQKTAVQEPTSTQLNVVDPVSFTASALLGVGLGSPAWVVVALKKLTNNMQQDEQADEDFGAALPRELKEQVQRTQPEVNDRVKKMWMNRERLNTVGGAMASSKAAGVALQKVSARQNAAPGKAIPTTTKFVDHILSTQAVPKGVPPTPATGRPKNIFGEKPTGVSTHVPAAPDSSTSYVAGLGGSSVIKGSYSTTKWKPGRSVPSAGGSYLENMSSSYASSVRTATSIPEATAATSHERSYSVSSWKPSDRVGARTGDNTSISYLANMLEKDPATVPATAVAPAASLPVTQEPPAAPPVAPPAPVSFVSSIPAPSTIPGKSKGAQKSYSVTSWKPGQKVNRAVSSSYLMNMGDNPFVAPSYQQAPSPRPSSTQAVVASVDRTSDSKMSYSVTSWKPGSAVPKDTVGSSYAADTQLAGDQATSYRTPVDPVPVSPSPAHELTPSSSTDYMAAISGGGGWAASSGPKKSYSMSNWKPRTQVPNNAFGSSFAPGAAAVPAPSYSTPPASVPDATSSSGVDYMSSIGAGVPASSGPKKSYNVSSWKPGTQVPSGTVGSSFSHGVAVPAPSYSSPPGSVPGATSSSGVDYMSSIDGGGSRSSGPKKSYSMSSWKPGNTVVSGAMGRSFVPAELVEAPSYSAPSTPGSTTNEASGSSSRDYTSNIGGGASSSGPKKSYSASSWKPGSAVADSVVGSFIPGRSAALSSVASSPSEAETSVFVDFMKSIGGGSDSSGPKKSYAVSSWKPANPVASGAFGTSFVPGGSSQTPSYSGPANPVTETTASRTDYLSSVGGSGGPKKSYSVSRWNPGSNIKDSTVGRSYALGLDTEEPSSPYSAVQSPVAVELAAPAELMNSAYMSNISGSGSSKSPKKSYSVSRWIPGSGINGNPNGNSYVNSMDEASSSWSEQPSYSPPAYAPAPTSMDSVTSMNGDYMSSIGGSSSGPKKSYSMTGWKPGTHVNGNGTGFSSAGPEPHDDSAMAPTTLSTTGFVSSNGVGANGSKKSYSTSKWKPGGPVNASRSFALSATPNSDYMSNLEGDSKRSGDSDLQPEEYEEAMPENYDYESDIDSGEDIRRYPDYSEYKSNIGGGSDAARGRAMGMSGLRPASGEYDRTTFNKARNPFTNVIGSSVGAPDADYISNVGSNYGAFKGNPRGRSSDQPDLKQPGFGGTSRDNSYARVQGGSDVMPQNSIYKSDLSGGSDAARGRSMPGLRPTSGEYDRMMFGNTGESYAYLKQPGYGGSSHDKSYARVEGGSGVIPQNSPRQENWRSPAQNSDYKQNIGGGPDTSRGTSMSGLRPESGEYDRTTFTNKPSNPFTNVIGSSVGAPDADYISNVGSNYGEFASDPRRSSSRSNLKQPGFGGTSQDNSYAPVQGGSAVVPPGANYRTSIGGGSDASRSTSMSDLSPSYGLYDQSKASGRGNPYVSEIGASVGDPNADYISNIGSNYGESDSGPREPRRSVFRPPGF